LERKQRRKGSTCSVWGSLINLDLPWNPTRLEQRKGRIQRIGQLRSEVLISGFGKFIVREKAQRRGRNPATGGDFTPVARRVVIFKSSLVLRVKLQ